VVARAGVVMLNLGTFFWIHPKTVRLIDAMAIIKKKTERGTCRRAQVGDQVL
jgi:hypothetical protein